MAILSFAEAARRAGVDRSTIKRQVSRGVLSATVGPTGQKGVEESELARVYPGAAQAAQAPALGGAVQVPERAQALWHDTQAMQHENALLRQQVESLRQQLEDVRQERDRWHSQATALLPGPRRGLLNRLAELVGRIKKGGI